MIVEGIVQGFGKITGDFGLGLLIAFDRFASVEPSISNVVEVLFAGALEGCNLKRKHCLFDDVLVHRYLLEPHVPLNASEGLFDGRGQRVVIGVEDEDNEQL